MSGAAITISTTSSYQQQIWNLHNCGIAIEIIALQVDMSQDEVDLIIIKPVTNDNKRKKVAAQQQHNIPPLNVFYLNSKRCQIWIFSILGRGDCRYRSY
ncbi:MAG: hypothetical protein JO297_16850 [Nitrososphaeraceae archaeon]|nr:hypothetical protein [Nitrososphaeraceae archaeon]